MEEASAARLSRHVRPDVFRILGENLHLCLQSAPDGSGPSPCPFQDQHIFVSVSCILTETVHTAEVDSCRGA